jgi:hypothetical protein
MTCGCSHEWKSHKWHRASIQCIECFRQQDSTIPCVGARLADRMATELRSENELSIDFRRLLAEFLENEVEFVP